MGWGERSMRAIVLERSGGAGSAERSTMSVTCDWRREPPAGSSSSTTCSAEKLPVPVRPR
jgi:hypothetical protein